MTAVLSTTTIVLCVRDPDFSNEFTTFEGSEPGVEIFDIDLGRSDLSDHDEYTSWRESHMESVAKLREAGRFDAADEYEATIDGVEA